MERAREKKNIVAFVGQRFFLLDHDYATIIDFGVGVGVADVGVAGVGVAGVGVAGVGVAGVGDAWDDGVIIGDLARTREEGATGWAG